MRILTIALWCLMLASCAHKNRVTSTSSVTKNLPAALPHGAIQALGDDVFYVIGSNVIVHDGMRIQASRTMTIIREHGELTLVNTMRLNDQGLRALEQLGRIKHVIRLGAFHGRDDAFYQQAYGATLWSFPEMERSHGEIVNRDLNQKQLPLGHARIIAFTSTTFKEAVLILKRRGGILISCDSIKNWQTQDAFFDDTTFAMMKTSGSIGTAVVDKTWLSAMNPSKSELSALADENFSILISAHGMPLTNEARTAVRKSIQNTLKTLP